MNGLDLAEHTWNLQLDRNQNPRLEQVEENFDSNLLLHLDARLDAGESIHTPQIPIRDNLGLQQNR